jgi:dihydrofolate reductase
MNQLPKVVFSRTLERVDWNNSRLVKTSVGEEVKRLKQEPGNELALFGSADLASTFMRLGLIDEYRILVTPVVLGSGTPMFQPVEDRVPLKLLKATTWSSGMVALSYQPESLRGRERPKQSSRHDNQTAGSPRGPVARSR